MPRRTGRPSTSSASSGIPASSVEPPVMTTPAGEQVLEAALLDLALHQLEDLLHPRLEDLAEDLPAQHARLRGRPPTGTSMVSSLSTIEASAQP